MKNLMFFLLALPGIAVFAVGPVTFNVMTAGQAIKAAEITSNFTMLNDQLGNFDSGNWTKVTNGVQYVYPAVASALSLGNNSSSGLLRLDGKGTSANPICLSFANQNVDKAYVGLAYGTGNFAAGSEANDLVLATSGAATNKILFNATGTGGTPTTMAVTKNGVGIGTTAPQALLNIGSGSSDIGKPAGNGMRIAGGGYYSYNNAYLQLSGGYTDSAYPAAWNIKTDTNFLYFNVQNWTTETAVFRLNANGTAWLASTLTQNSDRRLKKDFATVPNALEAVGKLRGVSYKWIDPKLSTKTQYGVIAQEVEAVYPDLVEADDKGMKSVNYSGFVAPFIEAIKELKARNDSLKAENADLKKRLDAIEKKLGL